jgi:DNA repair photolyase
MREFGSFYNSIDERQANTWCNYTKRLDMYGCGCQHDCSYCYSKSLLNFRGLWDASSPSGANLNRLRNRIAILPRNEVIKLGGMTDCFQPLEHEKRLTYHTIKLLNHYRIHYLIVTKSHTVANDEYMKIYDPKLAHFQVTITATSDQKALEYEKASLVSKRIKAIELLDSSGFDTSIRLSPFIPSHIDTDKLNKINCKKILVEFLKVNHWVKKWFDIDYSKYSLKYGGYEHLQLEDKIRLIENIRFQQLTVGEYVKDHHLYFSQNVNYNQLDCCNLNFSKRIDDKQLILF